MTQRITPERLHAFFRPRSIALVGATDNSRWSLYTYENLRNFGFPGPIYLINPNRETVHGQQALKSLRDLPQPVDLAYVMVSTARVLASIEEAADVGIQQFVVLTAGFGEIGAEGAQLERDLLTLAHARNLLILGPNGNGFLNLTDRIVPYGLPVAPTIHAGPVSIVLQSGALASVLLSFAYAHAIGLNTVVSMGNETLLSVTDVVDYLLEDDATQVVALFLESIRYPEALRRVANKARERGKAIVALKVGRSEASSRTALAHTGALVGNDAINDAALRQLGIIRVSSLEDLLTTAALAGYVGPLPGNRMGVVTPSGGACDILSDLAEDEHITLPDFAPQTLEQLRSVLPPFSTPHNPLDVTGYVVVDGTLQRRALEVVAQDPNIDFVLNLVTISDASREPTAASLALMVEQYERLAAIRRTARHPIINISNTCSDLSSAAQDILARTGLHIVAGMEHGMHALGRLLWWSNYIHNTNAVAQRFIASTDSTTSEDAGMNNGGAGNDGAEAMNRRATWSAFYGGSGGSWSEARARTLLRHAHIPIVPGELATSADEAVRIAHKLAFPVALKIQSAALPHKSDVGGVALNLHTEDAVRHAFTTMLQRVQETRPDADIEGILVTAMRPSGVELLVGIVRDPLWGLVITLGLGGIWTEVLNDTAVRLLPVSREEIDDMLNGLRGAALLHGNRGQTGVDREALIEVIARIATLAQTLEGSLNALEINPLLIDGKRIEALDVLVEWK